MASGHALAMRRGSSRDRLRTRGRRRRFAGQREPQRDARAAAARAVNRELAAEQLSEPLCQRQSKTGALVAACQGGVDLSKRRHRGRQILGRNVPMPVSIISIRVLAR